MLGTLGSLFDAGLGFGANWLNTNHNSDLALHNQLEVMKRSDQYQRDFLKDQFGIMRSGLEDAGYNPLLALGHTPSSEALQVGSGSPGGQTDIAKNVFKNAISSSLQLSMYKDMVKNQKLTNDKIENDISNNTKSVNAGLDKIHQEILNSQANTAQIVQSTRNQQERHNQEMKILRQQLADLKAQYEGKYVKNLPAKYIHKAHDNLGDFFKNLWK